MTSTIDVQGRLCEFFGPLTHPHNKVSVQVYREGNVKVFETEVRVY